MRSLATPGIAPIENTFTRPLDGTDTAASKITCPVTEVASAQVAQLKSAESKPAAARRAFNEAVTWLRPPLKSALVNGAAPAASGARQLPAAANAISRRLISLVNV